MEHKLSNFRSKPVVNDGGVKNPPAGRHIFTVSKMFLTNDRIASLNEPRLKDKLPEWNDATDQVAVLLTSPDGTMVRRFNAKGFKRMDDIPDGELEGKIGLGDDNYAVVESTMTRIEDPVRTESALNIINQFMSACGLPEGSELEDCIGKQISAEVFEKDWKGKKNLDIKNFRRVGDDKIVDITETVEAEEVEDDLPY